ncbi:GIY-YIG nuclease family protein [Gemella sp. zg-1178]|uniref:GIY-YIG nuclease family protein n=1 Tax=Gemella sp. zg-1178 TaxID=2840372 RepID=UPI001C04097C|nr:GIY-YIG nuclease family protein [Gemella sp. zg-1178]MBU0278555.1 GIY-YIG nuclease family protein [Gemella sp. zg-1178]
MNKKSEFSYILLCRDNTFYIGYTKDIKERIKKHNLKKGAKYTKGRRPVILKYFEEFDNKSEALKKEMALKKLSKKEKSLYISKNMTLEKQEIINGINEESR